MTTTLTYEDGIAQIQRGLETRGAYFAPDDFSRNVYVVLYDDGAVRVGDFRAVLAVIEDDMTGQDSAGCRIYRNERGLLLPIRFETERCDDGDHTRYTILTATGDREESFTVFTNV
jgi:hypothetical protein